MFCGTVGNKTFFTFHNFCCCHINYDGPPMNFCQAPDQTRPDHNVIHVRCIFDGYILYIHVNFFHIKLVCFMYMNVLLNRDTIQKELESFQLHQDDISSTCPNGDMLA